MIPVTTPSFTMILEKPEQAQNIVAARIDIKQTKTKTLLQKYLSDGDIIIDEATGTLTILLTQEESKKFAFGKARCQAHILYDDDSAWKTYVNLIDVAESLTPDVIAR